MGHNGSHSSDTEQQIKCSFGLSFIHPSKWSEASEGPAPIVRCRFHEDFTAEDHVNHHLISDGVDFLASCFLFSKPFIWGLCRRGLIRFGREWPRNMLTQPGNCHYILSQILLNPSCRVELREILFLTDVHLLQTSRINKDRQYYFVTT